MSRNLMPKSGAMAPYIVVNRDAAVAGVFSVDGEAGAVVLTSKYLQLSKYAVDKAATDASINSINESIGNINTALGGINTTLDTKAAKGANNDITELNALTKAITIAQGGTGASNLVDARTSLQVERLRQQGNGTFVTSPDGKYSLFIYNSGEFGLIESSSATVSALKVPFGGTGATEAKGARKNLNVPVGALAEIIPNGENVLNYVAVAGQSGYYSSGDSVTHAPPVGEGWWTYNFHCHGVDINGAAQYGVLKAVGLSGSSWINVLDDTGNWKGWVKNLNEKSIIPITQGGTGATTVAKARENLLVDQVDRSGDQTMLWAPDKDTYLFVYSAGDWGVYDRSAGVRKSLPIASGGTGADNVAQARRNLGVGIDQDVTFNAVWAKAYYGQGGAWTAAVIKEKSQQASDGANLLTYVENSWFGIQNYLVGSPGYQYQYVWSFNTFGGNVVWYSMRNDNGFYTPEGRCAIQGSDVRIKDRFEPPKPGAWDRVKQIGIIEFKYKGNDVQQRGYLAQQMSEIDNTYTFFGGQATDENGEVFEIMNVNDRAVMSDVITVVQQLQDELLKCKEQMEYMQRELNALRSSK